MQRLFVVTFLTALMSNACATTQATWTDSGFAQKDYGWAVTYKDPQAKRLLSPDWQLDNWAPDPYSGELKPKDHGEYVAERREDENRDGVIDQTEKEKVFVFDLKLVSARDNGVIWVQTFPMQPLDAGRELDVVLSNYADSLSGTGLYAQATPDSIEQPKARQFTAVIASRQRTRLGPHDAIDAVIEIADTAQIRLNPAYRAGKIRVVLAKFQYLTPYEPLTGARAKSPWPVVRQNGETKFKKSAVLLIGYRNDVEHFQPSALDTLMSQMTFADTIPLDRVAADRAAPAPASPSPAPPAAPPAGDPAPTPATAPQDQAVTPTAAPAPAMPPSGTSL